MPPPSRPAVAPVLLPELGSGPAAGEPRSLDAVADVPLTVSAVVGRTRMPLAAVSRLAVGDVVALDRSTDATVEIFVNGVLAARGDVIILDETVATRVSEIVTP